MITRNSIVSALNSRGYQASLQDTTKNGVIFQGIRIKRDDVQVIAPVIYTDNIISDAMEQGKTLEDVVDIITAIYDRNCTPDIDVNLFKDKDFVLSHVYIGIQKSSNEDLIKSTCDFEGLETYLYVKHDNLGRSYSIKLQDRHLDIIGISADEAWVNAESNTFADTIVMSMGDMLANMIGADASSMPDDIPMYVISNHSGYRGGANVLDRNAIKRLADEVRTNRFFVCPSSISEMILIPITKDTKGNLDMLSEMVKEINETVVQPEDRLVDKAFVMEI